jgi:hypothetical protein
MGVAQGVAQALQIPILAMAPAMGEARGAAQA